MSESPVSWLKIHYSNNSNYIENSQLIIHFVFYIIQFFVQSIRTGFKFIIKFSKQSTSSRN